MNNLKLKDHPGRDAADYHDEIVVNVESLESAGAFKPEHLRYIIRIFENTSNSRFQNLGYSEIQGGCGVY